MELDAHERAMRRRRNFIEMNRNAVSPSEYGSTLGYARQQAETSALRQHQLEMQGKVNEGIIGAAKAQGADAAEFGMKARLGEAGINKEIAAGRDATELKKWEMEHGVGGSRDRHDESVAKSELDKIRLENEGRIGLANTQGEWGVKTQAEANKGIAAQEEAKRQRAQEEQANRIRMQMLKNKGNLDVKLIDAAAKEAAGILHNEDPAKALAAYKELHKNEPAVLEAMDAALKAAQGEGNEENIPGYSSDQVAELKRRGYKWNGTAWVK